MFVLHEVAFGLFEWDENKNFANTEMHGIDFTDAAIIFSQPYLRKRSDVAVEERFVAIGLLADIEIAVVYTLRGDVCRIISARRARSNEREIYHQTLGSTAR